MYIMKTLTLRKLEWKKKKAGMAKLIIVDEYYKK